MAIGRKPNNSKAQPIWNHHSSVCFLCLFASMFSSGHSIRKADSSVHGDVIGKETPGFYHS